jgi:hypothetical protein
MEILGAPVITLCVFADQPLANLIVRLCDVHPDDASHRISYGVLNLAHRDGLATPTPLVPGRRYQVRIQLNDAGSAIPIGHRMRVAISTAYWPMIWPSPQQATVTIVGGAVEVTVRTRTADLSLPPLPLPETAAPERTTDLQPNVVRIDRFGIELGTEADFLAHLDENEPLSALVEMRQSQTIVRGDWRIAIDTLTRMSCNRTAFLLHASMRAHEDGVEVCHREWNSEIPRWFS